MTGPPGASSAVGHGPGYWLVLTAAAAVDVVNFQGVVAIVMRDSAEPLTWTVVAGFTVLALALSHQIGTSARRRADQGSRPSGSATAWLAFLAWFAMGLFAFAVRFRGPENDTAFGQWINDGPNLMVAGLFLTFYIATGMLAGLAGYQRADAAVSGRHLDRQRRAARDELGRVKGQLAIAQAQIEQIRLASGRGHSRATESLPALYGSVAELQERERQLETDLRHLSKMLGIDYPGTGDSPRTEPRA